MLQEAAKPKTRRVIMKFFSSSLRSIILACSLCMVMFASHASAEDPGLNPEIVNINTADAATLAKTLNGVGEKKAEAIVAYRETYGGFKAVDELAEVKGIGATMVDLNRDRIVLQ
jgi:competence protein ComEA